MVYHNDKGLINWFIIVDNLLIGAVLISATNVTMVKFLDILTEQYPSLHIITFWFLQV